MLHIDNNITNNVLHQLYFFKTAKFYKQKHNYNLLFKYYVITEYFKFKCNYMNMNTQKYKIKLHPITAIHHYKTSYLQY